MKNVFLLITALFFMVSCQNQKMNSASNKSSSDTEQNSKVFCSTITNSDGVSLKQTFNNSDGTCILELKDEIIKLKQERMASGIRYSNKHYIYTNWHGETKLTKDGKLIFSHTR